MAKLDMGVLGPFRGKVGGVVGYVWRGRQVVRAYRRHINYPDTVLQQAERQWFVGMVRFAAAARQALLLGLNETAARWQMTEGNAFVKLNKRHFGRAIGSASEDDVDYERLVLSCGAAAAVGVEGAAVGADGVLSVRWARALGSSRAADRVYVYAYNADSKRGMLLPAVERSRGGVRMLLPEGWDGRNTRLWCFAVDAEGRASQSCYVPVAEQRKMKKYCTDYQQCYEKNEKKVAFPCYFFPVFASNYIEEEEYNGCPHSPQRSLGEETLGDLTTEPYEEQHLKESRREGVRRSGGEGRGKKRGCKRQGEC